MITAWHNDHDLKAATVADLKRDHEKDHLVRGLFGELGIDSEYRGCQVGCLVMADMFRHGTLNEESVYNVAWHAEVESRFGVPRALAYLWDRTFEGVPSAAAPVFAIASVDAVRVGADLSMVVSRVMLDVLADPENGVWKFTAEGSRQRAAVEAVGGFYIRRLAGDEPTRDEWMSARSAADDAYAAYAADAAADAAYARRTHFTWVGERIIHHTLNAPTAVLAGSPE